MNTPYPPVEEVIHGVTVKDPYRWLEDRSLPETEEWLEDQKRRCDEYFAACPDLDRIRERVREYLDVEVMDQPARIGEKLFFRRRAKGQEQGCIYVRENGVDRLLVDPSLEGIFISVAIHRISKDGRLLAYERKEGGEDTKSIHIIDVETGQRFSTHLERGFARGLVFTPDKRGFYYCHETPNATGAHEVRLRLFDESVEDQVVFRAARSHGSRLVLTSDDVNIGAFHMRRVAGKTVGDFWITSCCDPISPRAVFLGRNPAVAPLLALGRIFVLTSNGQQERHLLELNPEGNRIGTIIPEGSGVLRDLWYGEGKFYALFLSESGYRLRGWTIHGEKLRDVPFSPRCGIRLVPRWGDGKSLFFISQSFSEPPSILEYAPSAGETRTLHTHGVPTTLARLDVRRSYVPADDEALVPITVVSKEGTNISSSIIMTAYGGFGIPVVPTFSAFVAILLEMGCTFVQAHVRGGSELGRAWHEAARAENKQRAISDFIACATWLYDKRSAADTKFGIFGTSNAALLIGAAMTQMPTVFHAVLCVAPLLDMVRYERFNDAAPCRSEYGSIDDPNQFEALLSYSPYHHVGQVINYPATLFVSGDQDNRCDSAHVRKMAALLQKRSAQRNPVIVDYLAARGHSPTMPLSVRIEALGRRIAFFCRELSILSSEWRGYDKTCA